MRRMLLGKPTLPIPLWIHRFCYRNRVGRPCFPAWLANPGAKDTTTWHHDEATGLLEAKEYADQTQTQYTYHPSGELATRTWARLINGQPLVTTYTYWEDSGGELKKVAYSDSTPDVEYTYTRIGQMETVTDAVGIRTFGYTDHLELETEDINGLYSFVITRNYEGTGTGEVAGRVSGVSVGDHLNLTADYDTAWHYDSSGRFSRVQGPGLPSYGAEYGYVTDGRRVETVSYQTDSMTAVASSTYSPLSNRNLVESVENKAGNTAISDYAYEYSNIGQRTNVVNTGTAFSDNAHTAWGYNDRREVTSAHRHLGTDPDNPGSEITAQRREYTFDPIGNRETLADGGTSSESYLANELNQYLIGPNNLDFNYDADGNLASHYDGVLQWDFVWDAENRLISAASDLQGSITADYTYDYRGRLVKAVYATPVDALEEFRYVWDDWSLLMVLDANNNPVRKLTWGLDIAEQLSGLPAGGRPGAVAGGVGGLLAVEEISGAQAGEYVYFYDANGNVGQVVDWGTETTAAHYEYDPFGRQTFSTGSYAFTNRFRFSTKSLDQVTGFYYYGYRYYSPSMGRWLNKDPVKEAGFEDLYELKIGDYVFVSNDILREERNLYFVVQNDLINRLDYLGLFCTIGDESWHRIEVDSTNNCGDREMPVTLGGSFSWNIFTWTKTVQVTIQPCEKVTLWADIRCTCEERMHQGQPMPVQVCKVSGYSPEGEDADCPPSSPCCQ